MHVSKETHMRQKKTHKRQKETHIEAKRDPYRGKKGIGTQGVASVQSVTNFENKFCREHILENKFYTHSIENTSHAT